MSEGVLLSQKGRVFHCDGATQEKLRHATHQYFTLVFGTASRRPSDDLSGLVGWYGLSMFVMHFVADPFSE